MCVWCVCSCFNATYVALTPKLLPGNKATRSERSVSFRFQVLESRRMAGTQPVAVPMTETTTQTVETSKGDGVDKV